MLKMEAQQLAISDAVFLKQGYHDTPENPYRVRVENVPDILIKIAGLPRIKGAHEDYSAALLQVAETIGKVLRGEPVVEHKLPRPGFIDELADAAFPFGHVSDFTTLADRDYFKAACRQTYGTPKPPEWVILT